MVHMLCWKDVQPLEVFSLMTPPSEESQQLAVAGKLVTPFTSSKNSYAAKWAQGTFDFWLMVL